MVNFSGLEFIFRFLPVFLIIYWIIPSRYRDALLFAGSLVFYAFGAKLFVILLFLLVLVNYVLGEMVWVMPGRRRKVQQRQMLVTIVTVDVIVLIVFKILALKVKASLLPLGLSFYIFKMISYQADLYLGRMRRRPSFMQAAAYFTMFPQIAQGPIMRFSQGWIDKPTNVRRQTVYIERSVSLAKVEDGICFFAMGLGMKILIADRLGILWNEIIKIGFESISTPLAWLGAVGYSLELYFDFWGYSLMAAGIGLMLGFRFVQNFIHPYAACGIADFYRRWHATLGSWFRDYVYIPLGGSRCGTFAVIRNLMIVWLLTGFWHGGTLNFVIWGLVLGLLIVWEKFVVKGLIRRVPLIGHLHVIVLIPLTWVIFAISDLKVAKYMGIYWPFLTAGILLCVPVFYNLVIWKRRNPIVIALLAVVFWCSVYFSSISAGNPFMYFSF